MKDFRDIEESLKEDIVKLIQSIQLRDNHSQADSCASKIIQLMKEYFPIIK